MGSSTSTSEPAAQSAPQDEAGKKVGEELLKLLALAVPTAIVNWLLLSISSRITSQPWRGAIVLLPVLVVVVGVCWWLYRREGWLVLSRRGLLVFSVYCLVFSVAAETELLTWRRTLLGYEESVPGSILGLVRLGDWHYWLLPEAPEANDLVVVTLPTDGRTRQAVRADLKRLLDLGAPEARGFVLDFLMDEDTQVDSDLSHSICDSVSPVLAGYGHETSQDGGIVRQLQPKDLRRCLPNKRQGHVNGYLDLDGRVRRIPLNFKGDRRLPALSLRAAKLLAISPYQELDLPEDGLLQYLPPPRDEDRPFGVLALSYAGLDTPPDFWDNLRDSFVFVGSSSPSDRRATPFGSTQGVVLHAWAAHGLRAGSWVRRVGQAWTFPGMYLLCYLVVASWKRRQDRFRSVLRTAGVLSVVAVAAVALAARARVWIDVSYPLIAVWLLVLLLWLRERQKSGQSVLIFFRRPRPVRAV